MTVAEKNQSIIYKPSHNNTINILLNMFIYLCVTKNRKDIHYTIQIPRTKDIPIIPT